MNHSYPWCFCYPWHNENRADTHDTSKWALAIVPTASPSWTTPAGSWKREGSDKNPAAVIARTRMDQERFRCQRRNNIVPAKMDIEMPSRQNYLGSSSSSELAASKKWVTCVGPESRALRMLFEWWGFWVFLEYYLRKNNVQSSTTLSKSIDFFPFPKKKTGDLPYNSM